MQTELILTKGSNSTIRIHILDEADAALSLTDFSSARFVVRSSVDSEALIVKSYGSSTTTTSSEPATLRIKDTYVEIDMLPSDTEELNAGTYLADVTFIDSDGKEFVTDIFYVKICSRVS